jgi:hypothetical protein
MFSRRVSRSNENDSIEGFIAHMLVLSSLTLIALIVLGFGRPRAAETQAHAACSACAVRSSH